MMQKEEIMERSCDELVVRRKHRVEQSRVI
jgi:hypothetical protein